MRIPFLEMGQPGPTIERVRHDIKTRVIRVTATERITPGMLRLTFAGEDLADFVSSAPDDHIKIFTPDVTGEIARRDYTPRRFDPLARTLAIDFALHDAGPATRWALAAQVGDVLEIGGPKGSAVISPEVDKWILIGDETGLPAIGRRIEESGSRVKITSIAAVESDGEHQVFTTSANLTTLWANRPLSNAADPEPLLAIIRTIERQPNTFVWVAAEANVARAIRSWFIENNHPKQWIKAAGYWVAGRANAHERIS